MIRVRVPATSANLGPGYDCMGLALGLYNYITVEEIEKGLVIDILDDSKRFLAADERNLVYRSMMKVFEKTGYRVKGLKITLDNHVMVTRGLGSSSAGIVGGLIAANAMCHNRLAKDELLRLATEIEGHPDNVAPALFGGLTVTVMKKNGPRYIRADIKDDLRFAALVPDFFLQTKKSRTVLPRTVRHKDAVFNASRTALLTASLLTGQYDHLRTAVGDRLHQDYRRKLIPNMESIFRICYQNGAYATYLSGAGPTIVAMVDVKNRKFEEEVRARLRGRLREWHLYMLKADNEGATLL